MAGSGGSQDWDAGRALLTVPFGVKLLVMVLLGLGFIKAGELVLSPTEQADARETASLAGRTEEETRTIEIYKRSRDAVVFITTVTLTIDPFEVFGGVQREEGTGTGVIVDAKEGVVLTNLHVIKDATNIRITLFNRRDYRARLLGYDEEYDVAVLKLIDPPKNLTSIPFGDSGKVEVGQRVLAIGNPFGLSSTLTTGIVSSIERTVRNPGGKLMRGLIQTDASINPGNSGGPLIDLTGRLVGINTAILSHSGDSAGIGFAVPINQLRRILPELIATGKVLRPFVGWILADTTHGPMVQRVLPGSPAEDVGVSPFERPVAGVFLRGYVRDFERADLIYAVNGTRVYSSEEVDALISSASPDKPLKLTLRRGGKDGDEREVSLTPDLR